MTAHIKKSEKICPAFNPESDILYMQALIRIVSLFEGGVGETDGRGYKIFNENLLILTEDLV